MKVDWQPLRDMLAQCAAADLPVPLWWRDDDAIAPGPALDRLEALSKALDLPVHIAVIPGLAQPALAQRVATSDHLIALVHGWKHENHAPPDQKKSEFGLPRAAAAFEAEQAMERMKALFGPDVLPVFVPPWNRIDPTLITGLAACGYKALSSFTPRKARFAAQGLVQVNCHLDPIDWHGGRGLVAPDLLVRRTVDHLKDRLTGRADRDEPLGYLTHHLVHSDELWDFTAEFLGEMLRGGAYAQPLAPLLEKT